jgi:hypothetical protein
VYGPYLSKQDNRLRIIVKFPNGNKTTISYPKYLVEINLNRYLTKSETIQHLDGNPLNNDLSNLIILEKNYHAKIDAKRRYDVIATCQWCKKDFSIKGNILSQRYRKDRQSNSFCSKQCTGKYGAFVQKTNVKFPKIEFEREYYIERDIRNNINEEQNIGECLTANTEA